MELVLIGNTGSGKSTLSQSLAERYRIPHISSGNIARDLARVDPITASQLRLGDYAPEGAMRIAIRQHIEEATVRRGGYILEGFPRTLAQLIALMQWTTTDPVFVYVDAPVGLCIQRLVHRGREDDNPDTLQRRLEAFQVDTMPVLNALEDIKSLLRIDARLPIATSLSRIESYIG